MPTSYTGTTLNYQGIDLDQREAQKILDTLAIVPGAAMRATIRAANKTATAVRRDVLRHLAAKNNLPQKTFNGRVFVRKASRKQNTLAAGVWYGVRPIPASKIGEVVKADDGYRLSKKVGKRWLYFEGAFEVEGLPGVFVRAPSGYKSRRTSKGWTEGRPHTSSRNLPIIEPMLEIDYGGQVFLRDIDERYVKTLGQEANFELQKSLGRIGR